MNTKNKILSVASAFLVAGVSIYSANEYFSSSYTPIDYAIEKSQISGIKGAMEYMNKLNANPITGKIEMVDVLASRKSYEQSKNQKSSSSLNLEWEEMGPDNVGGRTRALLIDPTNPQRMYAGGVAGGLWVSDNGGGIWRQVEGFDNYENINVSWMARASNGDLYVATGEGLASPSGINGNSGAVGRGVFKSTDNGESFTLLQSTRPSNLNSTNVDWVEINAIAVHPANPQKVYAGTNRGLRVSSDGGQTWEDDYIQNPNGGPLTGEVRDIDFANDGTVIVSLNNICFISNDGSKGSFENKSGASTGLPTIGNGDATRMEFGISPTNSNIIYAGASRINGQLFGVYYTEDKGNNWYEIAPGNSQVFEPYGGFLGSGQGRYDNIVEVNPNDPTEMWLGGVELWQFKLTQGLPNPGGSWNRIALEFPNSPLNEFYVHSDKHNIQWHPTQPNTVFVATDGGVSRSLNGGETHRPMNRNYNTIQFYGIAANGKDMVIGGTQDNGTILLDKQGNTHMSGRSVNGGDGGHCGYSKINPEIYFSTIYYGTLFRHQDQVVEQFYGNALSYLGAEFNPSNASFITPIELWESFDDPLSPDTIYFYNRRQSNVGPIGNGNQTSFTFTIEPRNPNSQIVPGSISVNSSSLSLSDDGSGNLTGSGTGTVDYTTGVVNVVFNTAPATSVPVTVEFDVNFSAGDMVVVNSNTNGYPIDYELPVSLSPGDSVPLIDKVQSKFVLGLNGSANNGSVWLTKEALNFGPGTRWVKISQTPGTVQHFAFTKDGNTLYYSTQGGQVYRVDNLSEIKFGDFSATAGAAVPSYLETTLIRNFSGRFVTSLAVDPNNDNHLVVTLGGYGQPINVYKSNNATTASPTFTSIQGNLPQMPVYSSIIEMSNSNVIILGTEYGIFASEDGGSTWVEENNGFARTAVHMLRQQTMANNFFHDIHNEGYIYAGTHGRGIFKLGEYAAPLSTRPEEERINKGADLENNFRIYPNPAHTNANLEFNIAENISNAEVMVFDMQGRMVKNVNYSSLRKGINTYQIGVSDLDAGTYIVRVNANKSNITQRLVVVK